LYETVERLSRFLQLNKQKCLFHILRFETRCCRRRQPAHGRAVIETGP
jgi:hypothetical protein